MPNGTCTAILHHSHRFDDNISIQRVRRRPVQCERLPTAEQPICCTNHTSMGGNHTAVHALNQCVHPVGCSSSKNIKIPLRQKAPLAFLCFNNSINCKSDATVTLKPGCESGGAGFSNYKPCHHIQSAVSGYRTLARKSV